MKGHVLQETNITKSAFLSHTLLSSVYINCYLSGGMKKDTQIREALLELLFTLTLFTCCSVETDS